MANAKLKHSDFTGLAGNYSKYRPAYSPSVLDGILGLLDKPANEADFVDVGAGTGIWTRMVEKRGLNSVIAVEPNEDMRNHGINDSEGTSINWLKGSGDATGLKDNSCDLLSMASSFHWVDFDKGTQEFQRVLRPGGRFVAIWNPRLIEVSPLLVEIEAELSRLKDGEIERVSSGRSGITATINEKLWNSPYFDDVVYLEGRHIQLFTPKQYIGVWRSVNDLLVQLGQERFNQFMDFVEEKISGLEYIEATYLTRAWAARSV